MRIDYDVNSKLRINGNYLHNSNTSTGPYGGLDPNETAPLAILATNTPGYQWSVGGTYVFNETTVDDFEIGASNNSLHNSAPTALTRTGSGIDFPVLFPAAITDDFVPNLAYGDNSGSGAGVAVNTGYAPFLNFNTDIDATDNLSKVMGQHTFKMGVYLQHSRKDQTSFGNANGNYNFQSDPVNPFDTGNGLANIATGIVDEFDQANNFLTGNYRYTNLEGYFQDTWKVTSRLTLDLGIRLSWYQAQYDQLSQISNFFPNLYSTANEVALYQPGLSGGQRVAVNPLDPSQMLPAADIGAIVPHAGDAINGILQANRGASNYLVDNRAPQIGPRIGIAWDVTGRQNIVIRTGGGIYYDRVQGNRVFGLIQNPPISSDPTIHYACINTPANCPTSAAAISSGSTVQFPSTLTASDPRAKIPTVYEVSFGVQAKLPAQMILDTSYVGTFSRQLTDETNLNGIPYGTTFQCQNQDLTETRQSAPCTSTAGVPASGLSAATSTGYSGACALPENLLRPFPGYGDIFQYRSTGTANYNSLQVGLTRRYGNGLFLGVAYTYSKALTTTPSTGIIGSDFFLTRIDGLTKQVDYTYSPYDQRRNLVFNYVYDFPSMFHSGFAHTLADGWQISGITRLSTGSPYQVTYGDLGVGGNAGTFVTTPISFFGVPEALTGSYTEVANIGLTGAPLHGAGGSQNQLNPAAFSLPTTPSLGLESPRSSAYVFTPGWNNFDMSLQKSFVMKERYTLRMRIDAFNVFNHTQISGVNSLAVFLPFGLLVNGPTPGVPSASAFGTASAVRDPRRLQLVARFTF